MTTSISSPALSQKTRRLSLETPLGQDKLALVSFNGQEEMSRLFSYQLEMLADKDKPIAAKDIVGKQVTFSVLHGDGTPRYFNGFVRRFAYAGLSDTLAQYRAEVVPWLWFLTRTSDCRIFQKMTIPDIIQQIFKDLGFTDFKMEIKGGSEWDYCVQYRETDFNFVSRLMEQEGIFYYFKHENGKHTMVLANAKSAYYELKDKEAYLESTTNEQHRSDNLIRWEHGYEFRTGKWAQTDYNFETPSTSLMTNTNSVVDLPNIKKFEFYDFPGEYEKKPDGEAETKVRMEEVETGYETGHGVGQCRSFSPGGKFKLARHEAKAEQDKGYVITAVQHSATVGDTYTTNGQQAGGHYGNSFTCIPDSVTFRPARVTPKPMIHGVQTAVVVGPGGAEIHTDKYGRIKVQFHWDREGKKDDNSSCWIRVSQPWAGGTWGAHWHPRIGQEVIVSFIEGDPDRPIVTGRVYNAEQMPPYKLPDNQTMSGYKSRSSPGGGPDNFNEIRFEDKKGAEQIFIHAEKNQDIEVENDETHWVGHDRKKTIDHDERVGIGNDRTESVGNNEKITIGNDRTENVTKNEKISIGVNRNTDIGKNEDITVGGDRTESVTKNETVTIGGTRTHTISKADTLDIKDKRSTTISKNDNLSVGTKFALVAGDEILLQTGDASILMKKNGDIQIKGKNITVTGSGKIGIKADGDMTLKGSKIAEN